MASREPTKTSYERSIFGIGSKGRPGDPDAIRRLILAGGEVARFLDPARPYLHPKDVDIALDVDRFDFAVKVEFEAGRPVTRVERLTDVSAANPSRRSLIGDRMWFRASGHHRGLSAG
jgi:hypothetical protein